MNWFQSLTGFQEESPEIVRKNITVAGDAMTSHINGHRMICGCLEIPSLGDLRARLRDINVPTGPTTLREVVADVKELHCDAANANALLQVASQFNLLEMISPNVTPETGVGGYENDLTQGPACAMAAGAGTIYRNYFAEVNGQIGQSAEHQIDCLADLGKALGNENEHLWAMKNGYAVATEHGLQEISDRLQGMTSTELEALRALLRIGIQWNTEVTISETRHTVTQVYCSALPVAYSALAANRWKPFAILILEAAYEATLCVGILNSLKTGNHTVYLTLLGGGAFGNVDDWILHAILRALKLHQNFGLDIAMVSYGSSKDVVQMLIKQYTAR